MVPHHHRGPQPAALVPPARADAAAHSRAGAAHSAQSPRRPDCIRELWARCQSEAAAAQALGHPWCTMQLPGRLPSPPQARESAPAKAQSTVSLLAPWERAPSQAVPQSPRTPGRRSTWQRLTAPASAPQTGRMRIPATPLHVSGSGARSVAGSMTGLMPRPGSGTSSVRPGSGTTGTSGTRKASGSSMSARNASGDKSGSRDPDKVPGRSPSRGPLGSIAGVAGGAGRWALGRWEGLEGRWDREKPALRSVESAYQIRTRIS